MGFWRDAFTNRIVWVRFVKRYGVCAGFRRASDAPRVRGRAYAPSPIVRLVLPRKARKRTVVRHGSGCGKRRFTRPSPNSPAQNMCALRATTKSAARRIAQARLRATRRLFIPVFFVSVRVPRRRLLRRGHLTQTAGRADAGTPGEGRCGWSIPVKRMERQCDLQATAEPRRLKRRRRASDAPRVRGRAYAPSPIGIRRLDRAQRRSRRSRSRCLPCPAKAGFSVFRGA